MDTPVRTRTRTMIELSDSKQSAIMVTKALDARCLYIIYENPSELQFFFGNNKSLSKNYLFVRNDYTTSPSTSKIPIINTAKYMTPDTTTDTTTKYTGCKVGSVSVEFRYFSGKDADDIITFYDDEGSALFVCHSKTNIGGTRIGKQGQDSNGEDIFGVDVFGGMTMNDLSFYVPEVVSEV